MHISSDFSRKHTTLFPKGPKTLIVTKQERGNQALRAFTKNVTFEELGIRELWPELVIER
jgi:hypothetical protein